MCRYERQSVVGMEKKKLFHILISADSLSLPRPWLKKRPTERPNQFFSFVATYPYLLERLIQRQMPDRIVRVSNLGRRGSTIQNVHTCAVDLVSWMAPDVVILHHGIVDCWIRNTETMERHTSEAEFSRHLAAFFETRNQMSPSLPVIMVKIIHTSEKQLRSSPEQNNVIDTYNALIEAAAAKEASVQVVSIPFQGVRSGSNVHEDGHHLSRIGHKAMADTLSRAILRAVRPAVSKSPTFDEIFSRAGVAVP